MAMPTCACASAGASLMPSPAIATTRPSRLQPLHHRRPSASGSTSAIDLVDAQLCAPPPRAVVRLSPVSMTMRRPSACSRRIASAVESLDRVGHAEQAREPAVHGHAARPSAPRRAAPRPRVAARPASTPCSSQQRGVAQRDRRARPRVPTTPLPGERLEPVARRAGVSPARRAPRDDGRRQRVLAAALQAGGQAQQLVGVDARRGLDRRRSRGLPSVSVPVLSTTSVSTCAQRLQRLGVLGSARPAVAPRPVPTMIDIGVARPSAHGQAMISTATALTSACASRGSGPDSAQTTKVSTATAITAGHEARATRDRPGAGWARGCAGPRRPCWTICASSVSAPTRSARITKRAGAVDRAADHASPGRLLDRDRLAGDHRLVDRAAALEDDAVDRHLLAGPHAQPVAGVHLRQRHVLLAAVGRDAPRGLRAPGPSSARMAPPVRLRARSSSTWPEQHQHDDDRRRLEVHGRAPPWPERRRGRQPGTSVAATL